MTDTKPDFYKCLLITEDENSHKTLRQMLETRNYHITSITSIEDVRQFKNLDAFNVIFLDMDSNLKGLTLLQEVKKSAPLTEVIVILADDLMYAAVEALRWGALGIFAKPFKSPRIEAVLEVLGKKAATLVQPPAAKNTAEKGAKLPQIIQASPVMKNLLDKIGKVAPSNTPILILGESGSGKDVIARTIHQKSQRQARPFFAISCAGFTSTLLESELFGHEKGAFTGADKLHPGLLEVANGGTLFMDEMGDMPLEAQAKLLRILESGEFRRVGGNTNLYTDVRLIAATNQDLEMLVKEKKFRQDLYYRINTVTLRAPSLRERKEDISVLAEYFLKIIGQEMGKKCSFSQDALLVLELYHWPGNVRQLRNTIESILLLIEGRIIQKADLPDWLSAPGDFGQKEGSLCLKEVEKQHILKVLKKTKGNKREAARLIGIDESTLYRKLKEYGIE